MNIYNFINGIIIPVFKKYSSERLFNNGYVCLYGEWTLAEAESFKEHTVRRYDGIGIVPLPDIISEQVPPIIVNENTYTVIFTRNNFIQSFYENYRIKNQTILKLSFEKIEALYREIISNS